MIESIITVLSIGFLSGFVFAMPIAGPISILVTTNALKGKLRFCVRTAIGTSIIEFFFVLVAVYGMTLFFSAYSYFIPYLLIIGSLFLFLVGVRIYFSKFELQKNRAEFKINRNIKENKGGLRAGLILNLTNPSLFFGIVTSSFIVLLFASSIGLNTGGLEILVQENVESIEEYSGEALKNIDSSLIDRPNKGEDTEHTSYTLLLSVVYATSLAIGSFLWLYILTRLLINYRAKIKLEYLKWIIRGLSFVLFGIGSYLLWTSINMITVGT